MLIRADARQIPLRDNSVQCVVTSPPYWGLRDYGTARWDGGDPECEHIGSTERLAPPGTEKQASNRGTRLVRSGDCLCGARRIDAQLGLEPGPDAYVANMVRVFAEVRRVLTDDGTLWLNLGDSYAAGGQNSGSTVESLTAKQRSNAGCRYERRTAPNGLKPKDLCGIPWRVAFALQADGWYLRSDIIWSKNNPMPESVTDRPTKAHEYIFLLSKSQSYYYDAVAIAEPASLAMQQQVEQGYDGLGLKDYEGAGVQNPSSVKMRIIENARKKVGVDRSDGQAPHSFHTGKGWQTDGISRNARSVWTIPTQPYPEAHFATFPEALPRRCILAGSRVGDLVFDPFIGSGTVGEVAEQLGRRWVGCDLTYHHLASARTAQRGLRFA